VAKEICGLDSLGLAERATWSRDKLRLLKLADNWLELAERIRRRHAAGKLPEHPLIEATFGRNEHHGGD
jgi:hypothetical protein